MRFTIRQEDYNDWPICHALFWPKPSNPLTSHVSTDYSSSYYMPDEVATETLMTWFKETLRVVSFMRSEGVHVLEEVFF